MARTKTVDRAHLRRLIDSSFDRAELASAMGVSEGRLSMLLMGRDEFRYSEMLAIARALRLDCREFERCFFNAMSSENLN